MGNRRCQPDLKARNAPLVIGNAVGVMRIAVGEAADELLDDGKDPAAEGAGREGRKEAWRGHFERLSGKPDGGRRPGAHECRDRRTRRRGGDLRSDAADPSPQRCAVDPDASRFLARKIANARLVEVPGRDHPIWTGDVERVADLIEELLTGERAVAEAERVLAALLATRINDTARLGDRMGSERNQRFQETWRLLVGRHGGSAAGMHGELMMSRFDSPARAKRCAGALHEAAALCRVWHQPMEHLLHRGVAVLLAVTGRDADRRMRGGASLSKACAAPHPALRATFSRQRGEGRLPVRNHHMADGRVVFQGIE